MLLKAPQGTTHVQSPTKVYPIVNGYITVDSEHPDLGFFLSTGFTAPCGGVPETVDQDIEEVSHD